MVSTVETPLEFPYSGATSITDERRHRKQRLAAAFRLFSRYGFDEGVAGHITARDPEQTDCFWVNPFGMDFGRIRVKDLALVNPAGEVIEGAGGVNRAAYAIQYAPIDDEAARQVFSESGSNVAGWFTFQPLYQRIVEDQPDLLDE